MQIHELKLKKKKARKTIGRGGKRGTYSGRGNKGQKARSGVSLDPLFEGGRSSLVERMKKVRGFKSLHSKKAIIKLEKLEKSFMDGATVNLEKLIEFKLVDKKIPVSQIKILGTGTLSKKLTIAQGIALSKSAKVAIEKAGGKIEK